jgi:hypothetical protein
MWGRTPRVQPNAAMMPALDLRDRPAAMEYTAPAPGLATTTRVVSKRTMLIGQITTFGALLKDTLLAVLGALAEQDAAVPKAVGSAERPATGRDRLVPQADPERAIAESRWRVVPWATYGVSGGPGDYDPRARGGLCCSDKNTLASGRLRGLSSAIDSLVRPPFKVGAATGLTSQGAAAATGLGAVIVRVQALFKAIKWAGIAYCRLIQALTL